MEGTEDLPEDQYKQHGAGKVTFKVKQEEVQAPPSKSKAGGGKADAVKGRML